MIRIIDISRASLHRKRRTLFKEMLLAAPTNHLVGLGNNLGDSLFLGGKDMFLANNVQIPASL